ncbi:MAG: cupin domain-containing protein [Anaerolineae bacterium]
MRFERINTFANKGWYAGPWNSTHPISIGYANAGVDEPHLHSQITEIYLVAQGTSVIRIEQESISLSVGDMLVVESGEADTYIPSSPDYLHLFIHRPGLSGEEARANKVSVIRERLGL